MQAHFHSRYQTFEPLLPEERAQDLVRLCEDFGSYGLYSAEGLNAGIGEGLPQRFDAAFHFIRSGGRFGRSREDLQTLAARTNYFRETYAYGNEIAAAGIEVLYQNENLKEAAGKIFDLPIVEPAIVYANLLLPGQELAIHTDVPEFRGMNRKIHPEWLLVVMHHSGLFDRWRMPIATAISWYQDAHGGAFAFYPEGADAAAQAHPVHFNTAILIDSDSIFHGVDRVDELQGPMPLFRDGMRLHPQGGGRWSVRAGEEEVGSYLWEEMRFSISWKAYCFEDEAASLRWREHREDLSLEGVLESLCEDLRARGRLRTERPSNRELAELLVDEYIHFPPIEPDSESVVG
jgi:hypothetical protein